jgi:uncharacterized protein YndB with AHSA1/START domain
VQAPIDEVFRHIADARTYPQWWPVYPKVEVLRDVSPELVGARARLLVKSALGYTLTLEVEIVEADPPRYLKTAATGQLEGTGLWELEAQGPEAGTLGAPTTHVTFTWIVASRHPLLNLLEPVAKPLFAWSHNDASRKGHLGLKRRLEKPTPGQTGGSA